MFEESKHLRDILLLESNASQSHDDYDQIKEEKFEYFVLFVW